MMKKSISGKLICAAGMFYLAMAFSTGVQAALIKMGQFSLVQDNDGKNGIVQGELVASVSFTAEFDSTKEKVIDGVALSAFQVTKFEVIDRTEALGINIDNDPAPDSLIGDFLYDAPSMAPSSGTMIFSDLYAYYNQDDAFVGLDGMIVEIILPNIRLFGFSVYGTTLSDSTALIANSATGFKDSLAQIPEPSALALLSIGLVGFGLARRRQSCG